MDNEMEKHLWKRAAILSSLLLVAGLLACDGGGDDTDSGLDGSPDGGDGGDADVDGDADADPPRCGDGLVQPELDEECDDGTRNSDTEPDACRTDCTNPICGDGVTDEGEECDDANDDDRDLCSNRCIDFRADICQECTGDDECGRTADRCIELPDGMRCLMECTGGASCPDGLSCTTLDVRGESVEQCVPDTGLCSDCHDPDGDGYGVGPTCLGSDCDEALDTVYEGAEESCNGVDDDCDGVLDGSEESLNGACGVSDVGICTFGTGTCDDEGNGSCTAVMPADVDVPEMTFLDDSCDGIDGDERVAVFVAPTGNDSSPGCTRAAPCLTIGRALSQAVTTGMRQVLLQAGTYEEILDLTNAHNGIGIYGGYDVDWARGDHAESDYETIIVADAMHDDGLADEGHGGQYFTVRARDATFTFQNLELRGLDAEEEFFDWEGRSSYVVHAAMSSDLTFAYVTIRQGDGADGSVGIAGHAGSYWTDPDNPDWNQEDGYYAETGEAGACHSADPPLDPSDPPWALGGSGSHECGRGGNGGRGGDCLCGGEPGAGLAGSNGVRSDDVTCGRGGSAGFPSSDSSNWSGGHGQDGCPATHGEGGAGGDGHTLVDGFWWTGINGIYGENGSYGGSGGGGGGGMSDGETSVLCVYGDGGCGGGAGGCGGDGGDGGISGGASIGIFSSASEIVVSGCTFYRGNGGDGGAGGTGAVGAHGGLGADCSSDWIGGHNGGSGGDGATGGTSGGGGGGAGGGTYGIYAVTSTLTGAANRFIGGAGGAGGAGGVSPADNGDPGVAGVLHADEDPGFPSTDTPQTIPDGDLDGITSTITVSAMPACTLAASVDLEIEHRAPMDLTVEVHAPNGSVFVLWDGAPGGDQIVLDDFALTGAPLPEVGDGDWVLTVVDDDRFDVGRLEFWTLHLSCI